MGNYIASLYTIQAGSVVGAITTIVAANMLMPLRCRYVEELAIVSCMTNVFFGGVGSLFGMAIAMNAVHTATFPIIIASVAALIALNRR